MQLLQKALHFRTLKRLRVGEGKLQEGFQQNTPFDDPYLPFVPCLCKDIWLKNIIFSNSYFYKINFSLVLFLSINLEVLFAQGFLCRCFTAEMVCLSVQQLNVDVDFDTRVAYLPNVMCANPNCMYCIMYAQQPRGT